MDTFIAHPENKEKADALKAFMFALKIRFEQERPYDPAFVEKIERSKEQFTAGNFKAIKTDDLWR